MDNDTVGRHKKAKSREADSQEWKYSCEEDKAKWFWAAGYELDEAGIPVGILLRRCTEMESLGEAERSLLKTINEAEVRIKIAFADYPAERARLFHRLLDLASVGFFGPDPEPETAKVEFETFKQEVAAASDKLRGEFIKVNLRTNLWAIIISVALILLWLPMHTSVFSQFDATVAACSVKKGDDGAAIARPAYCEKRAARAGMSLAEFLFPSWDGLTAEQKESWSTDVKHFSNLFVGFLLALVGIALGLILSGFLRNRVISYDNFDQIYIYRMHPRRYLVLIGSLAIVMLILLAFDVFVLGVGSLQLNGIIDNASIGLVIGLLCAISEPLIAQMVIQQMKPTSQSAETKPA